jgi:hypothetical protein
MLETEVATLLNPRGLGGFRVLIQQRGVPGARHRLLGLAPDSPHPVRQPKRATSDP